jgi:hypothetical protein
MVARPDEPIGPTETDGFSNAVVCPRPAGEFHPEFHRARPDKPIGHHRVSIGGHMTRLRQEGLIQGPGAMILGGVTTAEPRALTRR